jgi:putative membrane protein
MQAFKFGKLALATLVLGASVSMTAYAAKDNDFVEHASEGGVAEVEMGKLAQEKSKSADIIAFAKMMVADHNKANTELRALAVKHDLEIEDDAMLLDKAKKEILELREESFDKAYTNNQVAAHEKTVALFKKESMSSDQAELKAFATKTLPTLEAHLAQAKKLQAKYNK